MQQPFSFYSLSLRLNEENKQAIIEKELIKYYKEQLIELKEKQELEGQELENLRYIVGTFKREEEQRQLYILELENRVQLLTEEKKA